MISQKMKELVAGSSAIRAMFEEGKKMAALHGAESSVRFLYQLAAN
jgi:aspartate aminotransferase